MLKNDSGFIVDCFVFFHYKVIIMKSNKYPIKRKRLKLKRTRKRAYIFPCLLLFMVCLSISVLFAPGFFLNSLKASIFVFDNTQARLQHNPEVAKKQDEQAKSRLREKKLSQTKIAKNRNLVFEKEKKSAEKDTEILKKVVKSGETACDLLGDYFDPSKIYRLSRRAESIHPLSKIKSGHKYALYKKNGRIFKFVYRIDNKNKLCIDFQKKGIDISKKEIEYNLKTKLVRNEIESSLFRAVEDCGESARLAIKLAEIFAWDIDFIRDLRKGDSFKLIVQKRFSKTRFLRKNNFSGYGKILAAQFDNADETYRGFLYQNGDSSSEYFRANGKAVRKTFLKAPLNYTRISSTYTSHRKHPILDVVRPHWGIDYAAPRGTPIKSVADGVIISRSHARGAGNYIKVRHKNGYVTLYNHMSSFAEGTRRGREVQQRDTLGYVGSTGLATGPHLDYRVKKHGKYINPLHIDSQPVKPVPEEKIKDFQERIKPLLAVLKGKKPLYALSKDSAQES